MGILAWLVVGLIAGWLASRSDARWRLGLIGDIIVGSWLLGIRFVLGFLARNPTAGFAQVIYRITGPFMAPLTGPFGQPRFEGSVIEFMRW